MLRYCTGGRAAVDRARVSVVQCILTSLRQLMKSSGVYGSTSVIRGLFLSQTTTSDKELTINIDHVTGDSGTERADI